MESQATTAERERFPVLRTGERDPIDPYARRLIYIRDGYACQHCGTSVRPDHPAPGLVLEIDHVIPWSAMGSDRSTNLRTLCAPCNDERSNYRDTPPRLIGVTRACYWCAQRKDELPDQVLGIPIEELDRIAAFCGRCSTTAWVPSESWIL